jgi:hypothetical protein
MEEVIAKQPNEPVPWRSFWPVFALVGLVAGAIQWGAFGWFYALRVRWSGATDVDNYQARVVYACSALIYTLPALAVLLIKTVVYPDFNSSQVEGFGLWVPDVWSYYVSYSAVCARFELMRSKARLWFLTFPVGAYFSWGFVEGFLLGL